MRFLKRRQNNREQKILFKGVNIMAGNTAYKNKWCQDNCERITVVVPKGEKEKIRAAAVASGASLNAFVISAIKEKLKRENK